MSVVGSVPTTSAGNRAPSANTTEMSLEPSITWLLVMMYPSSP